MEDALEGSMDGSQEGPGGEYPAYQEDHGYRSGDDGVVGCEPGNSDSDGIFCGAEDYVGDRLGAGCDGGADRGLGGVGC